MRHYNPHVVTHVERLAFQLRNDKRVKAIRVIRKRRSSNLQINQQPLIYQSTGTAYTRLTATQFEGEHVSLIQSVE